MLQAMPLEYESGVQTYREPFSYPYSDLLNLSTMYPPEQPVSNVLTAAFNICLTRVCLQFEPELFADSPCLEFGCQGSEYSFPEILSGNSKRYLHCLISS